MKMHIKVSKILFELGVSRKSSLLPNISHMIEVTEFDPELERFLHPNIHHGNSQMMLGTCCIVASCPILRDISIIEK